MWDMGLRWALSTHEADWLRMFVTKYLKESQGGDPTSFQSDFISYCVDTFRTTYKAHWNSVARKYRLKLRRMLLSHSVELPSVPEVLAAMTLHEQFTPSHLKTITLLSKLAMPTVAGARGHDYSFEKRKAPYSFWEHFRCVDRSTWVFDVATAAVLLTLYSDYSTVCKVTNPDSAPVSNTFNIRWNTPTTSDVCSCYLQVVAYLQSLCDSEPTKLETLPKVWDVAMGIRPPLAGEFEIIP